MEEINLKELFDYYMSKLFIIIITTILVLALGTAYTLYLKVPLYKSNTSILLVSKNTTTTQTDVMLNQNLVTTYSEIIKSRKIINKVKKNLELDTTFKELSDSVTISSVKDTELINVSVSNKDNELAKEIVNEIATVFISDIKDIYNLENVTIIDKGILEKNPYNVNLIKEVILYFLVGLVLGFGVVFIMFYFDDSIKSVEQIENHFNLPVLGKIPFMEVK